MNIHKIALIQMQTNDNFTNNLTFIESSAREAAKNGAKLIIFPEVANHIGAKGFTRHSESLNGPTLTKMSKLAKTLGIWIHCGSIKETTDTAKMYNTSVVINDQGETVGVYRKLHLFDVDIDSKSFKESNRFLYGNNIVCVDSPFGKLGLAICYDLRFPELFRLLALKGAEIVILPANFTHETGAAHWEPLIRARAIENGYYVLAANQTGKNPLMHAYGHSMAVDPWGRIIAEASEDPCITYVNIDKKLVKSTRKKVPSLSNRRGDLYHLTITK